MSTFEHIHQTNIFYMVLNTVPKLLLLEEVAAALAKLPKVDV